MERSLALAPDRRKTPPRKPAAPAPHPLAALARAAGNAATSRLLQRYLEQHVADDPHPLRLTQTQGRYSAGTALSPANYGWVEWVQPLAPGEQAPATTATRIQNAETVYIRGVWSQGGGQAGHSEKVLINGLPPAVPRLAAPNAVGARILRMYTERRPCRGGPNPCQTFLTNTVHAQLPVLWSFTDFGPTWRTYHRAALVRGWVQDAEANARILHPHGVPPEVTTAITNFRTQLNLWTNQPVQAALTVADLATWIDNVAVGVRASDTIRTLFGRPTRAQQAAAAVPPSGSTKRPPPDGSAGGGAGAPPAKVPTLVGGM